MSKKPSAVIGFCLVVVGGCTVAATEDEHPVSDAPHAVSDAPKNSGPEANPTQVGIAKSEWAKFIEDLRPRLVPQELDGRVVGIAFYLGPRSSFEKIGLRSGQVVTAVNDEKVPAQQVDWLKWIANELERSTKECAFSVTVRDGDKERVLSASCTQ